MKFLTAFSLLAATALAVPVAQPQRSFRSMQSGDVQAIRAAFDKHSHGYKIHKCKPQDPRPDTNSTAYAIGLSGSYPVVYRNDTVSSITGKFNVPAVQAPSNPTNQALHASVGFITGFTPANATPSNTLVWIQAGWEAIADNQSVITQRLYYEAWPYGVSYYTGGEVKEGDEIKVTCTLASDYTQGECNIMNESNGYSGQSGPITLLQTDTSAGAQSAPFWSVDRLDSDGFLKYAPVTFHDAAAQFIDGMVLEPKDGTLITGRINGTDYSTPTINKDDELVLTYTG